jgi:DNA invertase Pin-like site-specific DNA recombinase
MLPIYTRQSVSDFDKDGMLRGPSLNQQVDAVLARPELRGLPFEHFEDADRSGKETAGRPGYLAMMERVRARQRAQSERLASMKRIGCTATTLSSSASWLR